MPRPRRAARERRPVITEGEFLWAYGELTEEHPDYADVKFFTLPGRLSEVWAELRDEVVAAWIKERPGTRPPLWWEFDAPRWTTDHGTFAEPQRRLGGVGTPKHEALGYAPEYDRGVPALWVNEREVAYYNGRAYDVHGVPIGLEYAEGNFPHDAIDPNDPPVYESEASYLDRHGLLTASERAEFAVSGWPEPEPVVLEDVEA